MVTSTIHVLIITPVIFYLMKRRALRRGHNAAGVPIAAGVLYPLFGLLLSPMIAAAAMSFSSVSVIGKALGLRRVTL